MKSQWWSEAEFNAGLQVQLKFILGWAVNNTPYYKEMSSLAEVYERMQNPADFFSLWQTIPVLNKTDLHLHGDKLRCAKPPGPHAPTTSLRTSGSTGIPVEIFTTPVTQANWSALTIRDHLVWKRDFQKRTGAIRFVEEYARSPWGVRMRDWGAPVRDLYQSGPGGVIHVSHPTPLIADWLLRLNPTYLLTYPSVAERLLDKLGSGQGKPPALEEIRFMSEPLDAALRQRLEAEWGVRCADMYSANETGHIALTCPEHGKLHVQSETVYVELLDQHGAPCQPGETGRVIVTPLHNLATPLIRYDLGDFAVAGDPCVCGRGSMTLEKVLGRVRNYAVAPDGRKFWPGSLGMLRRIPAVLQAQYVQVATDTIEMRLVVSETLSSSDEARAVEFVQSALGHPYHVRINYVDAIERGPTGKFEEFLSLIDNN